MIIVSDSGPLAYLVEIDVADHLPELYGQVFIPPAVLAELRHARSPVAAWANQPPPWLHVQMPTSIPTGLELDSGESEAIALAIELHADQVLVDERRGRMVAKSRGLLVAGTLAVIVDGARRHLFDRVATLEKLSATTFYASPKLLQEVRELIQKG